MTWLAPASAPFSIRHRPGSPQSPNAPFPTRYRSGSPQTRLSRLGIDESIWARPKPQTRLAPVQYRPDSPQTRLARLGIDLARPKRAFRFPVRYRFGSRAKRYQNSRENDATADPACSPVTSLLCTANCCYAVDLGLEAVGWLCCWRPHTCVPAATAALSGRHVGS